MRVGVDIIKISRMTEKLALRTLGEAERELYDSLVNSARKREYAAGRFAAKEAFVKASGRKDIPFSRIQFLSDPDGSPRPSPDFLQLLSGESISVSISHEREYAVAVIIIF